MLTLEQQIIAERKFLNYVQKTALGVKLDYFRGKSKRSLEILTDFTTTTYDCIISKSVEEICFEAPQLNIYFLCSFKLQKVLENMDERQRIILDLTIVQGLTEKEVASYFNISQQRVHAIKSKTLCKLREALSNGNE